MKKHPFSIFPLFLKKKTIFASKKQMARDLFHNNVREALREESAKVIIFDLIKNEILEWIKY